jgi:hypothetical protein
MTGTMINTTLANVTGYVSEKNVFHWAIYRHTIMPDGIIHLEVHALQQ